MKELASSHPVDGLARPGNEEVLAQVESPCHMLPPPNSDASALSDESVQAAASPPAQSVPKTKTTRKRLSAANRQAMREAIISAYNAGKPFRAILLRLGLREEQLSKMLAELFMAGVLTPIASVYEVLSVSQTINSIPGVASADGYVRVTKTDSGVILTPYIPEGDKDEESYSHDQ